MVVLICHLKKEMQLFYREEDSMGLSENKKQELDGIGYIATDCGGF